MEVLLITHSPTDNNLNTEACTAYKLSSLVGLALTPSGGVCEIAFRSDRSLSDAAEVPCMSVLDASAHLEACRGRYG